MFVWLIAGKLQYTHQQGDTDVRQLSGRKGIHIYNGYKVLFAQYFAPGVRLNIGCLIQSLRDRQPTNSILVKMIYSFVQLDNWQITSTVVVRQYVRIDKWCHAYIHVYTLNLTFITTDQRHMHRCIPSHYYIVIFDVNGNRLLALGKIHFSFIIS